ncbi:MAG: DUF2752 domain-containing protein [Oscillospiraceae bacterium]|nr:DUF2752 domain-containing protein [Oscillospiraceae bacterium]
MQTRENDKNAGSFRRFCAYIKSQIHPIPVIAIGVFWIAASLIAGTACLSRALTGLPCPACGISRAVIALLSGNFRQSVSFYPLLLPAVLFVGVDVSAKFSNNRAANFYNKHANKARLGFVMLIFAVYLVRMLLLFPHTEPMVYNWFSVVGRVIKA